MFLVEMDGIENVSGDSPLCVKYAAAMKSTNEKNV